MHLRALSFSLLLVAAFGAVAAADPQDARPTGSLEVPRTRHSAVLLKDGRVLVAGGVRPGQSGPGAELYDPLVGRFSRVRGSEERFRGPVAAARLSDGRVLICGGSGEEAKRAYVFDPQSDALTRVGDMREERTHPQATLLQDGIVLITGSRDHKGRKHFEGFDPRRNKFVQLGRGTRRYSRNQHTATPLLGGSVVVMAGGTFEEKFIFTRRRASSKTTELVQTYGQRKSGDLNKRRYQHAAVAIGPRQVLVAGGRRDYVFRKGRRVKELEVFDLDKGKWEVVDKLKVARSGCRAVLRRGEVLVVAGCARDGGGSDVELATVEVFNVRERKLSTKVLRLNTARCFPTATKLDNGKVLVVGGETGEQPLSSAELLD